MADGRALCTFPRRSTFVGVNFFFRQRPTLVPKKTEEENIAFEKKCAQPFQGNDIVEDFARSAR
jgi:hypothetical protein